jgi:uncharacterized Zn finger protein
MSRWSRWSPYPKPAPKRPPPERGIKVKSIGATWWGRRWVESLERLSSNYSNRLARGRTYARAGRVHDLEVGPGKVSARVTGSRATPYEVTLRIAPLERTAWEKAVGAMARQALFAAELLAGQMPKEIDQAFRAAGRSLFPATEADLQTDCSCPDWANPCKHVAATHYVLGEAFDKDPFLLFELRGRGKEEVLGALRRLRAGSDGAAQAVQGAACSPEGVATVSLAGRDPAEFERRRAPGLSLHFRIEPPASPATLLRQLGAPPSWSLDETPAEVLAPLYQAAGALARDLALRTVDECAGVSSNSAEALAPRPRAPSQGSGFPWARVPPGGPLHPRATGAVEEATKRPDKTEEKMVRKVTRRPKTAKGDRPGLSMDPRKLDRLIEEAVVDAYNESEQRTGLYTMLEERLDVPFKTEVLGVEVTVERVDLTDAEEIIAICAHGRKRQAIPILELPLPVPPPRGSEWIEAYRRWAGRR